MLDPPSDPAAGTPPAQAFATRRALPSLTALQAFERSARQLSFRRAARDMALSPSAISHQIRNLEDHFGVRLFSRDGRAVRLTQNGERYLDAVARALATLEEASRDLMHEGRGGRRELKVSALPYVTSTVMIPALAAFEARWPDLALRIEATHDYADFDHADVDVALRYGRQRSANLRFEPLVELSGLPVCAPTLIEAGLRGVDDLSGHVLIHMTREPRAWASWLEEAGRPGLQPRGELWFDSVPAALDAAEYGLGVALAPHPLIHARKGFGRTLIAIGPPSVRRQTLNLVCRPEQADASWMKAFRTWIAASLRRAVDPA